MIMEFHCKSPGETRELGCRLGLHIQSKLHIALRGDLGAGKTTFVQGLARGLGIAGKYYITSPTYALIHEYPGRLPLYHLDLYRLGDFDELQHLGFDEIHEKEAVVVVEWPEMILHEGIGFDLELTMTPDLQFHRKIIIKAAGLAATNLLRKL